MAVRTEVSAAEEVSSDRDEQMEGQRSHREWTKSDMEVNKRDCLKPTLSLDFCSDIFSVKWSNIRLSV